MNSTSIDIRVFSPKSWTITVPENYIILPMFAVPCSKPNWNIGVSTPIKSNPVVGWPIRHIGKSDVSWDRRPTSGEIDLLETPKMCSSVSIAWISMLNRSPKKKSPENSAGITIRPFATRTWASKNIWRLCPGSNEFSHVSGNYLKNRIQVVLLK